MIGWHHQLKGHEFKQTLGNSRGQGSLVCCSPWDCKESETTKQLNKDKTQSNSLGGSGLFSYLCNVETSKGFILCGHILYF